VVVADLLVLLMAMRTRAVTIVVAMVAGAEEVVAAGVAPHHSCLDIHSSLDHLGPLAMSLRLRALTITDPQDTQDHEDHHHITTILMARRHMELPNITDHQAHYITIVTAHLRMLEDLAVRTADHHHHMVLDPSSTLENSSTSSVAHLGLTCPQQLKA